MAYPPRRRPPSPRARDNDMYRFGGGGGASRDFDFRPPGQQGPSFPPAGAPAGRRDGPPRGPRRDFARRGRGGFSKKPPTSNRDILRMRRSPTPEQMEGMNGNDSRFRVLANAGSGSEDEDTPAPEADDTVVHPDASMRDSQTPTQATESEDDDHPRAKRAKTNGNQDNGDSAPRWSNPDPYSLPVSEKSGSKRDVVKMIRQAKVENDGHAAQASTAADFISFGLDEDDKVDEDDEGEVSSDPSVVSIRARPRSPPRERRDRDAWPPRDAMEAVRANGWLPDDHVNGLSRDSRQNMTLLSRRRSPSPARQPQQSKRKRDDDDLAMTNTQFMGGVSTDDTPWMKFTNETGGSDPGEWLHDEIKAFRYFVQPDAVDRQVRRDLVRQVEDAFAKAHQGCVVEAFGSFETDLFLPTADMDLVAMSQLYRRNGIPDLARSRNQFNKMAGLVTKHGLGHSPNPIWGAKVPIIKYTDRLTGLMVDISFENDSGLKAIPTILRWQEEYPGVNELVYLVKQLLATRNLNEVNTGGIGGFTIICLIVHHLHHVSTNCSFQWAHNNMDYLLMSFFEYYGKQFDYSREGLDMQNMTRINKLDWTGRPSKPGRLLIVDPNNSLNDVSGGSSKIADVMMLFRNAHNHLDRALRFHQDLASSQRRRKSILDCIVGGDYSSFTYQRERMRKVADSSGGRSNGSNGFSVKGQGNAQIANRPVPAKMPEIKTKKKPETIILDDNSSDVVITSVRPAQAFRPINNNDRKKAESTSISSRTRGARAAAAPSSKPKTIQGVVTTAAKPRAVPQVAGTKRKATGPGPVSTGSQAGEPQSKKSKLGDASRASDFKRRFPGVSCPSHLSKATFKAMVAQQKT